MKDLVAARRLSYDVEDERPAPRAIMGRSGTRRINPTLSAGALAEARNALEAAHASGDYRHQSVADLIRAALGAYGDGRLALTQAVRGGRKRRHTVELSPGLYAVYEKLPDRSRGVIIERALLTILAAGFES